jgi:ABC-type phosphate transport system ATPase subunit
MNAYKIRIVYEPNPIPEAPQIEEFMPSFVEEETVLIEAQNIEQAAKVSMLHSKINAGGRMVRCYDETGNEIFYF